MEYGEEVYDLYSLYELLESPGSNTDHTDIYQRKIRHQNPPENGQHLCNCLNQQIEGMAIVSNSLWLWCMERNILLTCLQAGCELNCQLLSVEN